MTSRGIVPSDLLEGFAGLRAGVLMSAGAGLGAAGMTIAQMVLLSRVVQAVLLSHQRFVAVLSLVIASAAIILVRAMLVFLREMAARRAAIRVKTAVRARLLRHLLQLGPAYLRSERTGELIASATEGIDRLDAYVSQYLPQRVLSVGVPLMIIAVILPYDWLSAVLLVMSAPVILLLMVLIDSYAEERIRQRWQTLGRVSACFLDVIQGLPTLLLFDQGVGGRKRVVHSSEEFRVQTLAVLRVGSISGATLELMTALAIGVVAATLGVRLLNGGIVFDHAFLVFLLTPEFYRPIRELGVQRHAAMEGQASIRRIVEILDTPVPVEDTGGRRSSPARHGMVELVDLRYRYPGSSRPALDGIRLTLPPGTCTALVGRSGSGKTTLVHLLLRFIDPTSGTILANGVPLALLAVDEWRSQVGLVPQRPYLFRGSMRDNIRLARPGASDGDVNGAAELAGVDQFVAELPHGYETILGERGAGLSAGQAQRLALARAFLKEAPLLILDEPTSALDPLSEALVREALQHLKRDRTILVVAHRINTVRSADQIAVLEQGRVVEIGSHQSLLRERGAYARLVGASVGCEVPA